MRGQRSSFEYAAALSISTWRMIQYKSMSLRRLTQASHKVTMACQQQYCQIAVVLLCPGTLIRRHRIAMPPPNDDTFYTVKDFNVGERLVLYGRVFSIVVSDYMYTDTQTHMVCAFSHFCTPT